MLSCHRVWVSQVRGFVEAATALRASLLRTALTIAAMFIGKASIVAVKGIAGVTIVACTAYCALRLGSTGTLRIV